MSTIPPQDPPPRKAISRRLRFEILRRDNNTCRYCHATDTALVIDHVVPVALGGSDDPSNLCAACKDCNAGKTSSSPDAAIVEQVSEDALRWAAAIRMAGEQAEKKRADLRARLDPFAEHWYEYVPSYKLGQSWWELPNNWAEVVSGLLASGLPDSMAMDAARIALTTRGVDDRFRYFIGVCRRMLADIQDEARRLIDEGNV